MGRSEDIECMYCIALGTTDIPIWRLLEKKQKQASLMIDGKVVPFDAVFLA